MNKRIVVGLDGSKYAKMATITACELANSSDGTVVGVGIIDLRGIESVERGAPLGAMYFAEKAEEHKYLDAVQKIQGFLADFESTCKEYGVNFELHSKEGVPFKAIVAEGKVADLIVVGLKTYYHFETQSTSGDTLRRVLEESVCPVLAVADRPETPKTVIIAYGGSYESAKALRAFVNRFHPHFGDFSITLLTVTDDESEGKGIQHEALKYLRCYELEPSCIIRGGKPEEVILDVANSVNSPLLVMGAFGKSKISELFFGSTARKLIEHCSIPLFVYH